MAKANITQYSATPSSNADINDINIAENCPASGLNNAIRELMAHLKNVDTGSQALTALSVAGSVTATTSLKTPLIEFTDGDNALTIADGGNVTANANLTVTGDLIASSLNGGQFGGRRNIVINGAMQVAQRGTSASSKTTSDYFTCDRWRTEASGATYNTSQQTNSASDMATTGVEKFLRMEVTTGNNNSGISQKIEAQNIKQFKGKKLTLSFYAKGTNPNGGSFDVVRFFSDGSASSTAETSSLTVTSSWVKYTYTFDYPDEGSVDLTLNTAKMALSFLQPAGDTSTNAWTLDLTSVQLEVGSQATPFEHRSFGEELALCQRYYTLIAEGASKPIAVAMNYTSTNMYSTIHLPTDMRASPTIEVTSGTNYYQFIRNIGADNIDDFFLQMTSNRIVEINNTSDISGISGHAGFIRTNNSASKFALKAEL